MHSPVPRDESVARNTLFRHAEVRRAMRDKLVGLLKRSLIQEKVDTLPRRKLSRLALALPPFRSSALFGNGMTRLKLCEVTPMTVGLCSGIGLRNGTLGGGHRTRF